MNWWKRLWRDSKEKRRGGSHISDEPPEEPSGLHEMTIQTVQQMRSPINDLITQLQEAKEQAQELVNTLDVPKIRSSSIPPGEGEDE